MRISFLPVCGRVYFVPVIEGPAARREHNFQKLVSIGEMLMFFGNDELCSRRAAPATPEWSFLTIKKRLRQAASRGKWCFSPRNAIWGKKKSACGKPPAGGKWFWSSPTREPLVHPNKGAIGAPQEGNHWCTPRREPLVHPNKGAIGSPKQRSHWFTSTREPLVHPKEPLVHPKEPLVHPKKGAIGAPNGEKHKNIHEMVIHPTF